MARIKDYRAVTESDKVPVKVGSVDQIDVKTGADATKTNQMPSNIQRTIFGRSDTVPVSDEPAIGLPLQSHVLKIPDGGPGAILSDNHQAIKVKQNKLSSSVPIAANGEARAVPTYDRGVTELEPNTMPSTIQRTIFGRSDTVPVSDEPAIELPLQSHVLKIPDGGPGAILCDNHQAIKVKQNKLSSTVPIAANGEARAVPTYDRGATELGPNTLEAIAALLKADKDKTDEEDEKKKLHDLGFSVFIALSGLAISIFVAFRKEFSKNENVQLDVIPLLILFAQILSLVLVLSSKIPDIDIEFLRVMWFAILASAGVAITGFTCYLLMKFWIFVAVASALFVVIILFLAVRIWKKMRSSARTPCGKTSSSK